MLTCGHCGKPIPADALVFAQTNTGPRYDADCWAIVNAEDAAAEAACDRWHDGYFAKERPTDPDALAGWTQARADAQTVVIMAPRPEGYYHSPIGTFD